jgi:carboxyl-terminal processing protease
MTRGLRYASLLGTAFLAGVAVGPASTLICRQFERDLGVDAAFAQDSDRANTYRLLAVFGFVFERVRTNYVDLVSDNKLIENALDGMLTGLDPHSGYMNAEEFHDMELETEGKYAGIGIEVSQDNGFVEVVGVMDDTPAAKVGVKVGDSIIVLNGVPVQQMSLKDLVDQIRGSPNSSVRMTIKRIGLDKLLELSMKREIIHVHVVKQRMEPDSIGYVQLAEFGEHADSELKQAVKSLREKAGGKLKALVLDLRDNPGGLLDQAVAVAGDFIVHGEIVSTRARHAEDDQWIGAKGLDILHGLPLVVMINGGSASSSEIVAGALQDHHRAVLVGTRSFGKGSVQTVIPLPGDDAIRLTTARYYTPSGRSIQGLGVTPDVLVAETREGEPNFGSEQEADLNHALTNEGGVVNAGRWAAHRSAGNRQYNSQQTARGFRQVRSRPSG